MSIPVKRALAPPLVKKNTAIVQPVLTSLHDLPTGANRSLRTSQAIASMPSPSQLVSLDQLFVLGLGLLVVLNLDLLDLIANPAEDLHHVNWTQIQK
ncbi:hypothetical protein PCASD_08151 [Puccinia coronata f. sp. avenae]|uniref:Uncharacterized protein n=1 Tax=Puccinia coronata f. sp. avenae TaxID=200324 RepID=A0A2N5VA60_9BASI|nr:hypothetical protein PCASD_08151 [Puccinia coronata f. sp. avenae]